MRHRIAKWYRQGLWTQAMMEKAVEKGVLTAAQLERILTGEE